MSDTGTLKPGDVVGKLMSMNPNNDLVRLLQPIVNECIKNYEAGITVSDIDGNGNFS
jgi:hypothetical protein